MNLTGNIAVIWANICLFFRWAIAIPLDNVFECFIYAKVNRIYVLWPNHTEGGKCFDSLSVCLDTGRNERNDSMKRRRNFIISIDIHKCMANRDLQKRRQTTTKSKQKEKAAKRLKRMFYTWKYTVNAEMCYSVSYVI